MLGIFQGLKVTIKHFFSPKLTRMYPYEKPNLPHRSRGLIQLITERETGILKCESCLLCEKVCPPRAITIRYRQRGDFRYRPVNRPRSRAAYYRPRSAQAVPYQGPRPIAPAMLTPGPGKDLGPGQEAEMLAQEGDLVGALHAIQERYGYLPRPAIEELADVLGVGVSELFSTASLSPDLRLDPASGASAAAAMAGESNSLVMPGLQAVKAVEQAGASEGGSADERG